MKILAVASTGLRRQIHFAILRDAYLIEGQQLLLLQPFKMIADIGRANRMIYVWGGALNIPQLLGGLLFITHVEAQIILAAAIVSLFVAGRIHENTPFSRLIGLCHLPWLGLLPWLVYRIGNTETQIYFEAWLYYTSITIAVSLVFDAWDIYRYVKGQKTFAWASDKIE